MPAPRLVRALEPCYVQLQFRDKGAQFSYDGPPNVCLEDVEEPQAAAPKERQSVQPAVSMEDLVGAPKTQERAQETAPKPRSRIKLQSRPVSEAGPDQ